jgi:hypothetical protein
MAVIGDVPVPETAPVTDPIVVALYSNWVRDGEDTTAMLMLLPEHIEAESGRAVSVGIGRIRT